MIASIGRLSIGFFEELFLQISLWMRSVYWIFRRVFTFRFRFQETIHQLYVVGVESQILVVFCVLVVAITSVLEFSYHMKLVLRQDSLVPAFSTLIMVRELCPVVTAMLFASRVGAGMAAEIATMKNTDQISLLEVMAVSPVEYLVVPRLLACTLSMVCLVLVGLGTALLAACLLGGPLLGYGAHEYFNRMLVFVTPRDLLGCGIKAVVFGMIVPITAAYQGLSSQASSQGVGKAATAAVVQSSMSIIVMDFVLTYLFHAL